jgi:hypothetical protein
MSPVSAFHEIPIENRKSTPATPPVFRGNLRNDVHSRALASAPLAVPGGTKRARVFRPCERQSVGSAPDVFAFNAAEEWTSSARKMLRQVGGIGRRICGRALA